MKFNTEKWNAYVAENGGSGYMADLIMSHPLFERFIDDSKSEIMSNIEEVFDPIKYDCDAPMFLLLGLKIEEFLIAEKPETLTGKEAIDALFEGKVLKDYNNKLYKFINNQLHTYEPTYSCPWQINQVYLNFFTINKFEVVNGNF